MLVFLFLYLLIVSSKQDDYYSAENEPFYYDPETEAEEERTTSSDWTSKLEKDVLPRGKLPPYEDHEKISVQVLFSSFDHISLDEDKQILHVEGRFCMVWNDQRLLWNPNDYNGVSDLHVSMDDIWHPIFKASNNMYVRENFLTKKDRIHIYVSRLRVPLVYVVICPRFSVMTGCALEMSNFPYDQHICSFMITVLQYKNVNLLSYHSVTEQHSNMRFLLTRDETRPTIGDFTIMSINSTTKWSDGYKLFDESDSKKPLLPIALQMIVLKRHYSSFMVTFGLPAMIFALLNVAAAIMTKIKYSLYFYILNICAIGIFFRDASDRFPLYFQRVPDIIIYIAISFSISLIGLLYVSIREIIFQNCGKQTVVVKIHNSEDLKEWKDAALAKIMSFDFVVILISFITTIWYIL